MDHFERSHPTLYYDIIDIHTNLIENKHNLVGADAVMIKMCPV